MPENIDLYIAMAKLGICLLSWYRIQLLASGLFIVLLVQDIVSKLYMSCIGFHIPITLIREISILCSNCEALSTSLQARFNYICR